MKAPKPNCRRAKLARRTEDQAAALASVREVPRRVAASGRKAA